MQSAGTWYVDHGNTDAAAHTQQTGSMFDHDLVVSVYGSCYQPDVGTTQLAGTEMPATKLILCKVA